MMLVARKSSTEKFLRRIAPQAIIILTLAVLMTAGAVVFQRVDPAFAKQAFHEVVFFEFITISTIGYGNQYPQTDQSKVFTILFSIIGVPLLVVTLGNFGKYLTKFYWKLNGWMFSKKTDRELVNDKDIPIHVIAVLYFVTLLIGFFFIPHSGAAYSVDDCYFSFISFATVGFGDTTPSIDSLMKFCKVSTYLLWGTILNIMLINYVTNCFAKLFARQPFRGRDVEILIGSQCITVSEITALVAQQFHASPHEVRAILHEIDEMMEEVQLGRRKLGSSESLQQAA